MNSDRAPHQFEMALLPRTTDSVLRERIARLESELRDDDVDATKIAAELDRLRALLGDRRREL